MEKDLKTKLYKRKSCNGTCIARSDLCGGKCKSYTQCLWIELEKEAFCLDPFNGRKQFRDCDGKCIKRSKPCNGLCYNDQCKKEDGSCIDAVEDKKVLFGKCNGKCTPKDEPCNGKCDLGISPFLSTKSMVCIKMHKNFSKNIISYYREWQMYSSAFLHA